MTDLERVMENLGRLGYAEMYDRLDAHRKEDAEREADAWRWCNERDQAQAELTELREGYAVLARSEAAKMRELTELREHSRKYEKMWAAQVRELAELREQGGLLTEQVMYMDNQLTELREAVRAALETLEPVAHRLPASAWNLVYDRLRQLIEETG